jgi:polyhydroxyalkanoate synthase
VIALRDHICAPPASRALMERVGSTDKAVVEFDTGHIGLTTSRRAHAELWPQIARWLEERR